MWLLHPNLKEVLVAWCLLEHVRSPGDLFAITCTQPSSPMKSRWLTHATHGLVQRFYMIREPMYVSIRVTESPPVTCFSLEGVLLFLCLISVDAQYHPIRELKILLLPRIFEFNFSTLRDQKTFKAKK